MTTVTAQELDSLLANLRAAASLGDPQAITARIKRELEDFSGHGVLLPDHFHQTRPDTYCRRLLHRDEELGWTAVVMTWGPGQRTALHDHAGIWCVEGVIEGEMEVHRFDLADEGPDGVCRFTDQGSLRAGVGSAGALIPPFEYHVLGNARTDQVALTLHVYGGDMDHCSIYEPLADATSGTSADTAPLRFRRQGRSLRYDA